jgi:thiol-disulfide isomerase/thioredoxin
MSALDRVLLMLGIFAAAAATAGVGYWVSSQGMAETSVAEMTRAAVARAARAEAKAAPAVNAWDLSPVELVGLDGARHRLDEWRGKVILLNFWASWCGPCQAEIPDLARYQRTYGKQGLQVVGLGLDETRKLNNVARTLGINYPVLVADEDHDPGLLARWGNRSEIIPYTVVIARDGRISYVHRGILDDELFDSYVMPLL